MVLMGAPLWSLMIRRVIPVSGLLTAIRPSLPPEITTWPVEERSDSIPRSSDLAKGDLVHQQQHISVCGHCRAPTCIWKCCTCMKITFLNHIKDTTFWLLTLMIKCLLISQYSTITEVTALIRQQCCTIYTIYNLQMQCLQNLYEKVRKCNF